MKAKRSFLKGPRFAFNRGVREGAVCERCVFGSGAHAEFCTAAKTSHGSGSNGIRRVPEFSDAGDRDFPKRRDRSGVHVSGPCPCGLWHNPVNSIMLGEPL